MKLHGKVAIVTGGAQGIGRAIAMQFLNEGAKVVIADMDDKLGDATEKELGEHGEVSFVHCDISERLNVRNLVASTLSSFSEIDILVNNAGTMDRLNLMELEEEEFDRVMRVNLKGAFLCSQTVARHMIQNKKEDEPRGSIINISSSKPIHGHGAYTISKVGLDELTRIMAQLLTHHGIRVNAVAPGFVRTKLHEPIIAQFEKQWQNTLKESPLHYGELKDIAALTLFLASDESNYITGQVIEADGGNSILTKIIASY